MLETNMRWYRIHKIKLKHYLERTVHKRVVSDENGWKGYDVESVFNIKNTVGKILKSNRNIV